MPDLISDLPNLVQNYALTSDQIESYRKNGHVLLRVVCAPEEMAAYRRVLVDAAAHHNTERRKMEERDTYGKAFLQITNLWENDEASRKFVFGRRFAKIAAALMGAQAVRLYHDQALFKEPRGGHTPWHQDQYYWPLETDETITMWMPLVDADTAMGTMRFASGSHRRGFLGHRKISDESEAAFERFIHEQGFTVTPAGAMRAGDATFHSGWTLHGAPGNATDTTREAITVIYYPDGTRLLTPDNTNRQDDLDRWFPGQKPGEIAASPLNPLLYP